MKTSEKTTFAKSVKASVCIFIFNDKEKLLLQLRSANDDSFPLHYDYSAAGEVEVGESIETAAHRELMEELGVKAPLTYIGEDEYDGEKMYLFKAQLNDGFNLGMEVDLIKFASISEIFQMITDKEKFHPDFLYVFKKLFK
ncbi:NUDIX domain-containing protein [Francisella hispaniensis]|uniref:Nudix hydrolase domain-containing protein n=1 Tax=Francisella hispaniensis FSC454 TaxID=1088883 RepID=A0AAC9J4M1_9GAMM|nr:NUDIX domain-containing protein [Francisella hispaniensis]APD49715.1 hypothetical protein FSC454_00435 [Francisella hispaniensis FSC454]KYW87152.1 hypothetical protein AUF42_02175 [Francisella hispaniensis FSC454]